VGKTFSRLKREIFVAGYNSINGKNHALYEDFSNLSSLDVLGQDSKDDSGWADGSGKIFPRKSVAADLDGDGIDEVVIVTLVPSTDKILINKGVYKNKTFTVTQIREIDAPDSISETFLYYTTRVAYWNLIAADLNGDNKKECIFTFSRKGGRATDRPYVYVLDNDLNVTTLDIWPYLNGYPTDPVANATNNWYPRVTAADYDQDGKDEICLMLGVESGNFTATYVILDDKDAGYSKLAGGTVSSTVGSISQGNVIAADFTGDGLPDTVFFGDISNGDANLLILLQTTLDGSFKPQFEVVHSVDNKVPVIKGIGIPPLAAGDVDGDGAVELFFYNSLQRYKDGKFTALPNANVMFPDQDDTYEVVMGDITGDQKDDMVSFTGSGKLRLFYYASGAYKAVVKEIAGYSSYETGCLPNVDDDSFILLDTGQRELLFSDPHVIAVLASPPYYEGVNEDGDGGTSFGYSKSSGTSSSNSVGFSVGVSVGSSFEAPFGLASAEFESSLTSSFSWAQSNSVEISESWGWNNTIAQDLVVFTAIPFDVYYYEVLKSPAGDEAKPGDILTVNVPRKPQPYHTPLPEYNKGVPEEYQVKVNHTLGSPGTYFTTAQRDQQKSMSSSKGLFSTTTQMTAGSGSGSTTINIEKVSGEDASFSFDLEREIEAKVGVGSIQVGVSAGFSYGYETTSSVSSGTYIEGTVPAIPTASYKPTLDFKWGLMAYPKRDPNQNYIFVTYWTDFLN
jgi:hypothetical protein